MKVKIGVIGIIFGCGVLVMSALMISPGVSIAQECHLIRLEGSAGDSPGQIKISPRTVNITKGSCVVWVNWVIGPKVTLKFSEGKKCSEVTGAATMGWQLDSLDNCYVTQIMPEGGTGSLRFDEEGVYGYTVVSTRAKTPETVATGNIVVEK